MWMAVKKLDESIRGKNAIRYFGNLPDNVTTINYQIQSVAKNEATEHRIFTLYFIQ